VTSQIPADPLTPNDRAAIWAVKEQEVQDPISGLTIRFCFDKTGRPQLIPLARNSLSATQNSSSVAVALIVVADVIPREIISLSATLKIKSLSVSGLHSGSLCFLITCSSRYRRSTARGSLHLHRDGATCCRNTRD
jgi:hypothetical protein